MTMTDPIADMLTRIRNALMVGKREVAMPNSRLKVEIARILQEEGYIEDFRLSQEAPRGQLHIRLKYFGNRRQPPPGDHETATHQHAWLARLPQAARIAARA